MTSATETEFNGDTWVTDRVVRLAEVGRDGLMRVEAVCHWLQDVAHDHLEHLGLTGVGGWVLRRLELDVDRLPSFDEQVEVATGCTESGPRCADRVTSLTDGDGRGLSGRAVWVCVDPSTGRSRALPVGFHERFPLPHSRRRMSARLRHARPSPGIVTRPWATRESDFDVYGHLNNAAACAPLDELLSGSERSRIDRVELEYRQPISPGEVVTVAVDGRPDRLATWLLIDDDVRASARVTFRRDVGTPSPADG